MRVAVPPRDRLTTRQIIDEGYLFPNHPLPGLPRPAAANPTDRPTDPDTLARVAGLVGEFRTHYRALRDEEPEFSPGATEAEIAAVEAALGLRLPEDLRALYLVVNGAWQSSGLLGFWDLWSVAGTTRAAPARTGGSTIHWTTITWSSTPTRPGTSGVCPGTTGG